MLSGAMSQLAPAACFFWPLAHCETGGGVYLSIDLPSLQGARPDATAFKAASTVLV